MDSPRPQDMNCFGRANRHILGKKTCVLGVSRDGCRLLQKMVSGLNFQQTCGDEQSQSTGSMTRDPQSVVYFRPAEPTLVRAT
jgi:hypothetical protein